MPYPLVAERNYLSSLYLFKRLTLSACHPLRSAAAHNDMSDVCGRADDGVEHHLVKRRRFRAGKPK